MNAAETRQLEKLVREHFAVVRTKKPTGLLIGDEFLPFDELTEKLDEEGMPPAGPAKWLGHTAKFVSHPFAFWAQREDGRWVFAREFRNAQREDGEWGLFGWGIADDGTQESIRPVSEKEAYAFTAWL